MKKLIFTLFFLSSNLCLAIPPCAGNDASRWNNCVGEYFYDNGDHYIGEWKNGAANGKGTHTYTSGEYAGDKYVGEFKNNQHEGRGIYTKLDGEKFTGVFRNNGRVYGTNVWANGEIFTGTFINDRRVYGTNHFPDGSKYSGEWKNDLPNGEGIGTYANGVVEEGIFENGYLIRPKKITLKMPEYDYYPSETTPEYTPPVNEVPESEPYKEDLYDDNEILMAGNGTGFAVTKSGYVVTNHHVSNFCNDIYIHDRGKVIPATVVSSDSVNDLALLKADFKPTNVLPFSRKRTKIMQTIYVAGYPFGKEVSSSMKVTKGIVSSLSGIEDNFSDIQVDAAIQVGNSGGPIYNEKGNVIAVIKEKLNPKYTLKEFGVLPDDINYGVKSHVVVDFLESNNVKLKASNSENISTDILGEIVTGATYYLSCHMTWAKIKQFETQKVMFKEYFD